jgi:phosphoribosylanthranilate isomerase
MSPKIKICGLSTPETIDAALDAGADMVGLMFFRRSPRFVEMADAAELADRARGRVEIVAVVVDMDDAGISAIVERVRPDWLQLHGRETVERTDHIGKSFAPRVMKVVGVGSADDLATVDDYRGVADAILLDARPPKDADRPGGLGRTFDWTLLEGFSPNAPWMLSGGLTPANVAEAIQRTGAPGVDVSSGVETAPGRKDPDLIAAFIAAARSVADLSPGSRIAS